MIQIRWAETTNEYLPFSPYLFGTGTRWQTPHHFTKDARFIYFMSPKMTILDINYGNVMEMWHLLWRWCLFYMWNIDKHGRIWLCGNGSCNYVMLATVSLNSLKNLGTRSKPGSSTFGSVADWLQWLLLGAVSLRDSPRNAAPPPQGIRPY